MDTATQATTREQGAALTPGTVEHHGVKAAHSAAGGGRGPAGVGVARRPGAGGGRGAAGARPARGSDYALVSRALEVLATTAPAPSLGELAGAVGLTPFHFQRLFSRWTGVSPKRFAQALAAQRARRALQGGGGVLEAALEAGLSGPSRLHDLLLTVERMTPGEYRAAARGVEIRHGVHDTAFGPALVAATPRGVCAVAFLEGSERAAVDELRARWPGATLREDRRAVKAVAEALSARMAGRAGQPLSVLLRGTPFQLQVWEALLRVPEGRTVTYGAVAEAVGAPRAVRAVGTAVGDNPLAWLIPCHRVIRASGVLGEYRWGAARKAAMLACEGAAGVRWR